ncbi:hypothetical protein [Caproiciproducens galactitolivorans]|uniref:hypothetical protein n=1 Tax=Caproiciproducens galactitolivorans TaxID=642589 RepID=UPI00240959B8|nr:hypothetical protein [Caproiciproducens galactitolivorans]
MRQKPQILWQSGDGKRQTANTAAQRANAAASSFETIASNLNDAIATKIGTQKGAAGSLASLNAQKKLVQMPTAADVGASNPNLLLNDFSVWQRGTSFSITDASKYVYTADRWRVKSATTITV